MESEWAYLGEKGKEGKERRTISRAVRVSGVNSTQICKFLIIQTHTTEHPGRGSTKVKTEDSVHYEEMTER